MKNLKNHLPLLILILAVVLGGLFRFYKLGQSPAGLYVDEAALGYNALSILKTGRDEFGKFFPVMFRSFTTFQSPIYTYLIVPLIPIFDLTPLSTRLPSAIFGLLTIPLLFLLIKEIAPEKYKTKWPAISALLLALSPWHIQYSRTAYETNIALFFLLLGSLLFFYCLKKPWLLILASFSFAISFTAYRAEVILIPLLVLTLVMLTKNSLLDNKKFLLPISVALLVGSIILAPTVSIMGTPGFQTRSSELNIFSNTHGQPWGYVKSTDIYSNLLNNHWLLSVREFVSLYSSYFSPRYIFSLGDSGPRKPFPDLGTMMVWQLPLYLWGIYSLIKEKNAKNIKVFVFSLLLLSPIPAAMTRDPYSTIRSLPMVIPLIVITAFGLIKILDIAPRLSDFKKYLILFIVISYSSAQMFISIFYHHDYYRSEYWNYGWESVAAGIQDLDPKLPIIVDTSRGHHYILLLFFLKYDPVTYQKDNFEVSDSDYYTNMTHNSTKHLGNITVKNFVWGVDTDRVEKYLIVDGVTVSDVQIKEHNLSVIKTVLLPDGKTALRILKTNPTQ